MPKYSAAEQAIIQQREERAAQILDQAIDQLVQEQQSDMQSDEALERRAGAWLVRFLTGGVR